MQIAALVDGTEKSFWEVPRVKHQVVFVVPVGNRIASYRLIPAPYLPESIRRMPTMWSVETSADGLKWSPLTTVLEPDPKAQKTHSISATIKHGPYYRFTFQATSGDENLIRIGEFSADLVGDNNSSAIMAFDPGRIEQ